jgi:hypothetical protein
LDAIAPQGCRAAKQNIEERLFSDGFEQQQIAMRPI